MKIIWKPFLVYAILLVILTGCGKSVSEQIDEGLEEAATIFKADAPKPTDDIDGIELYLPQGYHIEKGSAEMNYVVTKGDESYLLFVNALEKQDSELMYDTFKEENNSVLKEKTFKDDGRFGFAGVIENSEEQYELVVASGGVKLSTLSEAKKLNNKLEAMMEIVHSVQVKP